MPQVSAERVEQRLADDQAALDLARRPQPVTARSLTYELVTTVNSVAAAADGAMTAGINTAIAVRPGTAPR